MKKIIPSLLVLIFFLSFSSKGQPTITSSTNPVVGTIVRNISADTTGVFEGPAGTNKTYDFSNIKSIGSEFSYTYVAASSTPDGGLYSTANLAYETTSTQGTAGYLYIKTSSGAFETIGLSTSANKLIYTDPQTAYKFPMTMNSSFTDKFAGTITQPTSKTYRSGTISVTADGYGTLKLPKATYSNVLRSKLVQYIKDSTHYLGDDYILEYNITTYNFMTDNIKQGLFSISYYYAQDIFGYPVTIKSVSYYPVGSGAVDNFNLSNPLVIFPNPANNSLQLELPARDVKNLKIEMTDLSGKAVLVEDNSIISGNTASIITSDIPEGIYFVHLYCGPGRIGSAKVIITH